MTGSRARRARGVLAWAPGTALLIAAGAVLLSVPAAAQSSVEEDLDEQVSLVVEELSGVLTVGGEFGLRVRVSSEADDAVEGLRVVGTLHTASASRFAFQRAVDEGRVGAVVDGFFEEIDELEPGHSVSVALTRSATQLGLRRANQFGVYPLRLRVLHEGAVVDEVRTAVVFSPERVDEPVQTALVLPLQAPPLLQPDGTYDREELVAQLGRAGQAQGLLGSLASRPRFPATLAADALLLDEAADLEGGFTTTETTAQGADDQAREEAGPEDFLATQAARLRERTAEVAARPNVDLLALPYARADLVALVRGDMAVEAARHVREGRRGLRRHARTAPLDGALWPPDGLDPATLSVVARAGVDTLILGEPYLHVPEGGALSPSPIRELASTRGARPTVLVPDPWLADVLERTSTTAGRTVAVQRVVAETAAVYFERPFAADVRGLLLAPPQDWQPARGTVSALIDGLDEAAWLQPVTLSRLARSVEAASSPVRLDYPQAARTRELPVSYVAQLRAARTSLGSLAQVLTEGDDTPSQFDRMLRTAASVHFRTSPGSSRGRAMLADVTETVIGLYSSVDILEGPQVWMDAEGPVPVTLVNHADVPLQVRVRLLSQRFRFAEAPDGQVVLLEPDATQTLTFQARAATSGGRAPISVVVEDVDGVITLAESTVVVRSTTVSVAALVVTVAAGLFLLAWLVQQAARRRRSPAAGSPRSSARPTAQAGRPTRR